MNLSQQYKHRIWCILWVRNATMRDRNSLERWRETEQRQSRVGKKEKRLLSCCENSCSAQVIGVERHNHHRAAIDLFLLPCGSLCRNEPENEDDISFLELQLLLPSTGCLDFGKEILSTNKQSTTPGYCYRCWTTFRFTPFSLQLVTIGKQYWVGCINYCLHLQSYV